MRIFVAHVEGNSLVLGMTIEKVAAPSTLQTPVGMNNRYYYHWLLDTDNNPATGRSNSEYEGTPTGVAKPIGAELAVMIGWRDGLPGGIEVFDALDDNILITTNFTYQASGNTLTAVIPLASLGLTVGQTIAVSAYQEGSSDGWAVDWMESAVLTLQPPASGGGGLTLPTDFAANPLEFWIQVQDQGTNVVDTASVAVKVDGQSVAVTANKADGVTTIKGAFPSLLPPNTQHTNRLTLTVSGTPQAKDFVFQIGAYSVLAAGSSLKALDKANKGFVAKMTQIDFNQTGVTSLHTNIAQWAEKQVAGQMLIPDTEQPCYNQASDDSSQWKVTPQVLPGTINWFELAPGQEASLNFTNSEPLPLLVSPAEGVACEVLTYVELAPGFHQLGLYTEGGLKVTLGLKPTDPVLLLVDNSVSSDKVPSYYARNYVFDVVVQEAGFYPIRVLWFQSKRSQEPGLMLEFYSLHNRQLHLVNDAADPVSLKAYRAGELTNPGVTTPTLSVQRQGGNLVVSWTGILQVADQVTGPWQDYADQSQSPMTVPMVGAGRFARARNY
jgi:hypothetical protein